MEVGSIYDVLARKLQTDEGVDKVVDYFTRFLTTAKERHGEPRDEHVLTPGGLHCKMIQQTLQRLEMLPEREQQFKSLAALYKEVRKLKEKQ